MSSNSPMNFQFSNGSDKTVTISTELMVGAIVFFFMVIFFVFFIHLYAKWRWGPAAAARRARSRLIFTQGQDPLTAPHHGLHPSVILSLPVSIYRSEDFKEGLECAVCLSELADGEKARLLPKCNHGFHLECIDMWFHSHSTCPLCRYPVGPETNLGAGRGDQNPTPPEPIQAEGHTMIELPNLPTNVLFWGTQDRGISRGGDASTAGGSSQAASVAAGSSSSSSDINKPHGMLVIDIPRRMVNGFSSPASPLPSSRFPTEEMKSSPAATPASTRLKSIRRLLSMEKRVVAGSPYCSPRGADIEQGVGGAGAGGRGTGIIPRTPTSL